MKKKEKNKWQCDDCCEYFDRKLDLAEHLRSRYEEFSQRLETVAGQMDDLKIKPFQ